MCHHNENLLNHTPVCVFLGLWWKCFLYLHSLHKPSLDQTQGCHCPLLALLLEHPSSALCRAYTDPYKTQPRTQDLTISPVQSIPWDSALPRDIHAPPWTFQRIMLPRGEMWKSAGSLHSSISPMTPGSLYSFPAFVGTCGLWRACWDHREANYQNSQILLCIGKLWGLMKESWGHLRCYNNQVMVLLLHACHCSYLWPLLLGLGGLESKKGRERMESKDASPTKKMWKPILYLKSIFTQGPCWSRRAFCLWLLLVK